MKQKFKFYVEKDGFWAEASVIVMAMAIFFRLIGTINGWGDRTFALTQIILPVLSGLLFLLCVLLLGKLAFWSTSLPVLLGVVFFVLKSLGFESKLHMVLCVILYVVVAVLYVGTVFTLIPTKWLLVPLFGLPFLYHIFIEDLPAIRDTVNPLSFADGMQEMSVLCIMLSLLLISLAMKKQFAEPKAEPESGEELPKMKAPKLVVGKKPEAEAEPAGEAEKEEENETDSAEDHEA